MNKYSLLALSFAFCAASLPAHAMAAPTPIGVQWSSIFGGNDHYYQVVSSGSSWEDANVEAQAMSFTLNGTSYKGYLATITSAAENALVTGLTFMGFGSADVAWLGGKKDDAGAWIWSGGPEAGLAFTFTNWNPGEPNNMGGDEKYLELNYAAIGGWNDASNNPGYQRGYIVEYSPVPLPAALPLFSAGLLGIGALRARKKKGQSA